jgi:hypothetical protein
MLKSEFQMFLKTLIRPTKEVQFLRIKDEIKPKKKNKILQTYIVVYD